MVMAEEEIFSRFAEILEQIGGVSASTVTFEADLVVDLEISSLPMVEIIVAAEDKFGVQIPDEVLGELRTVRDFVRYALRAQSEVAAT